MTERKNLGIEGAIKIPGSNYSLVPGSIWAKWKTIQTGDPESDESESIMLVDSSGKLILDEQGETQEVYRPRSIKNKKDIEYFKKNKINIFKSFDSLYKNKGQDGDLYIGRDGKLYDPSKDVWMENETHEKIRSWGGIFCNDTFIHLWKKTKGILLLDGSYGSGKTTWAITHLLRLCLDSKKGFNCFYGRKIKDVAVQLHKNIIEEIKRNNWEHLFEFSEADNGSKNIHCKANGDNKDGTNGGLFQIFGCDELGKVKGWNNATHILVDEVNEIDFKHFGMLQSRLRRPGMDTLFIGCFNACDVLPIDSDDNGCWLWKYFFSPEDLTNEQDIKKRKIFKSAGLTTHHSDFLDNYCQNNYDYWHKLIIQAGLDYNIANRFANGDWGTKLAAQNYYNRFDKKKHVRSEVVYSPSLPIISTWDQNTQPYQPCLFAQIHGGNEIWFFDEFIGYNPNNNVTGVSNMIIEKYGPNSDIKHKAGMEICGDATSNKEDSAKEKGVNYFTTIRDKLKYFKPTIEVDDSNPDNKSRGEFLNLIFYNELFGIKIFISDKCIKFIEDLENTMQDIKNINKPGCKDKSTKMVGGVRQVQPYGHLGDAMDYLVCKKFAQEYLQYKNGDMTMGAFGGLRSVRNSYEKSRSGGLNRDMTPQLKRTSKHNGGWSEKYKELNSEDYEDSIDKEEEEDYEPPKYKSKNQW